jgi:DNA-binding transcriptional regulator YdaS (Cro superfamily)
MADPASNLKSVLEYFGISNTGLAKTLPVDPSLVSRWLKGQRKLKASSPAMDALAEYILSRARRNADVEWLKTRFRQDGLPTDLSSVYRIKQNLIMWLASDGEVLRQSMGSSPEAEAMNVYQTAAPPEGLFSGRLASLGSLNIAIALEPILSEATEGSGLDIFLSSDGMRTITEEGFSRMLLETIQRKALTVRLVICISGNTKAMSRLIGVYMQPLVSGCLQLLIVHGMTQAVTHQMHIVIPGKYAALITEVQGSAPPVAAIVEEVSFINAMQESFERAARYAQPVLHVYGDAFSRNILEILYMEYATPGSLDVVKDSLNPMFMETAAYDRALAALGNEESEFAWRSAEFVRFKTGMDETMAEGAVFREILSLERLNQIARDGFCRMPGLYFMRSGFVNLHAPGCAELLQGYIHYLETASNFHVLILDDLSSLHAGSCWHIKQNASVAVNCWSGDEPLMIHTDQILLVGEFQTRFDELWSRGKGCIGSRAGVIATLHDVLKRLIERHGVNLHMQKWKGKVTEMEQHGLNEELIIDEFVNQLKGILEKMPVVGETNPADREAVREIGKQIYNGNIARGMKKVAAKFAEQMPQHARRLDMLWDGVGSWMG